MTYSGPTREPEDTGLSSRRGLFARRETSPAEPLMTPGVEGTGEFCIALERRSPGRPRTGWLELRDGRYYGDSSPRDPARPYVRGCLDGEGRFLPESREVL